MAKYPVVMQDPYIDPKSGLLRNELGITDQAELDRAETAFSAIRACELEEEPIPINFDLDYLRHVHRTLFGAVYSWAGELRTVDLFKGNMRFANVNMLESAGHQIFQELKKEQNLHGLDTDMFSKRAGYYLGEINVLHPFREGNGRSQRVFIGQLARANGYCIDWVNVSRDEMTRASIDAYYGNSETMSDLIRANISQHDQSIERVQSITSGVSRTRRGR
ncbi:Fic/DOC family protein [Bartonella sp. DGB2]|uniref:Fic/DOC family protein n=1 Tax=Bartonella sp. DGB2 TaxID=3388426 RepID=UPI0039901606